MDEKGVYGVINVGFDLASMAVIPTNDPYTTYHGVIRNFIFSSYSVKFKEF